MPLNEQNKFILVGVGGRQGGSCLIDQEKENTMNHMIQNFHYQLVNQEYGTNAIQSSQQV